MAGLPNFYSGLSGIELPIPKYQFPVEHQKSSRLTYYATFFNSLEVNSSFYKIPLKRTIEKWAASVPDNFTFTFKLFKEITHCKGLRYDSALTQKFIETISHVGKKRGCLLVQFPPSLKSDSFRQVEDLLNDIGNADAGKLWKVALEFRDKSWHTEEVFDLLENYDSPLVMQDIPKSATPFTNQTSETIYVRFHGPTGNYRGSYSDEFLEEYAGYVREWLADGKKVFVYFNNTAGDAFQNLSTFDSFMMRR
jgi:uncharacterized protein YecE (DUF72 family)